MNEEELLYDFIVVVFFFAQKTKLIKLDEIISLNSHIKLIKNVYNFSRFLGMNFLHYIIEYYLSIMEGKLLRVNLLILSRNDVLYFLSIARKKKLGE